MDSKKKIKKRGTKNEKEKKMASKKTEMTPDEDHLNANQEDDAPESGSSTDSEELVNAINYNTITSLAALKDIIQGDNDTPETDSFFQHYFMNHCNNLSSRNSNSTSPFPFNERRRLSQCREEDEDDEKKDVKHSNGSLHSNLETICLDGKDSLLKPSDEEIAAIKADEKINSGDVTNVSENEDSSKRTVMGAKHKFLVTKTEQMSPTVKHALRTQVSNAHTIHFGTKGVEEQRPNVRTIFTGQNLHRDKNYFDSSLIEIRSTVDEALTSSEDIWVKRTDAKNVAKDNNLIVKESAKKSEDESSAEVQSEQKRERSGTWSSQTARKEKEIMKKTIKDSRRNSDDRRQKRDQRLDAAITRSSQSVGERKRRGSADDGQAHPMYQQTIHGTSGVSRRPALFDMFKSRPRGDAKKQPSIMQQVKAAVQSMTKSGTASKESVKSDKAEVTPTSSGTPAVKTKDGSAHPHPGSDTRYYHTVTASTSRRPSAMAKVMDIFRGRASIPGQTVPLENAEKRRAVSISDYYIAQISTKQKIEDRRGK
ncbi:unnamed protein product [Euphydryas editha]|uniref:Uncharacterized protein n=1 Tax=Euphydryas editha TaxID=104508 RepID=A0AAU9UXH1_EUPED|nr:unnamed protein product [Euphydryas editha]